MNSAHRQVEIVNAAFDCIATTGHLSLSTTELAYKVGISQPAIFRHFRSKQQLHQAILDEANMRVIEELKSLIGHSERWNDPFDLLQDVVVQMGAGFERAPGVWLTLICQRSIAAEAEIVSDERKPAGNKCAITQLSFALQRLCNAAIENKQLASSTQPEIMSNTFISLLFGIGQLWLNNGCNFDIEEHLSVAVKGILAGHIVKLERPDRPMSAIA